MAEYIDLNNTEVLAEAGENAKLVVEEDGELKRIPASAVGQVKTVNGVAPDEAGNVDVSGLPEGVPVIQSATVGQTVVVKAVDESGKPTEWEAVDMSAGGKKYILSTTDMSTFTATNFTYDGLRAEFEAGNVIDVFVTASEPEGKAVYRAIMVAADTDNIYITVDNGLDAFGIIMESDGSAYIPS